MFLNVKGSILLPFYFNLNLGKFRNELQMNVSNNCKQLTLYQKMNISDNSILDLLLKLRKEIKKKDSY